MGTLRQAMQDAAANAEPDLITINGDLAGFTITLLTNSETTDFGRTELTIGADEVTIDAGDAPGLTIRGNQERRIFGVGSGSTLSLLNVTVADGLAQGGAGGAGGSGYTYSATGLPAGLSMDSSGLVTGTPTTDAGSPYTVEVTVTEGDENVRII